jgi:hypothetical protein
VNKLLANGKGVFREEESEGSRRQNLGSMNRNHIRLMQLDKTAKQSQAKLNLREYGWKPKANKKRIASNE